MHAVFCFVENDGVRSFEHVFSDFEGFEAELLVDGFAHFGLAVMVGGQTVHELAVGVAGKFHDAAVHLVGQEHFDAFLPHFVGFAHGDPHVGVDEVAALHAFGHIVRTDDLSAGFLRGFEAHFIDLVAGLQGLGSHGAELHAHLGRAHHEGVAHVEAGVAEVGEGDLAERLVAVFLHGEEVRKDLRGVGFIGQAVPHGYVGEAGQLFHDVLAEAAVFDAVVHAGQHAGGIGHGFLLPYLRAAGQVGGVAALVEERHFEDAARAGGGLLEDEGHVLAREELGFSTGAAGLFEIGGEVEQVGQLFAGEVGNLEEVAVFEIHGSTPYQKWSIMLTSSHL